MKSFTSQYDEMYYAAKAILEGKYNLTESNALSEGEYIVSTDNLKKTFKALSAAQNGLVVAIKDYNSIEGPSGHGSGHYQAGTTIEYYRKKIKQHIGAMIEIQEGLMEEGAMTKQLQRAFIDELEDNVESLQKEIESRNDNNYVLKSQLSARKAILDKAKKDLADLKESYCDGENSIQESFRPGAGMVPAPIGPDTVKSKGLKKLWGIAMRAGKWADTFVGLYDLPDGKAYGIINADGTTRYASIKDFNAAFKKLRL